MPNTTSIRDAAVGTSQRSLAQQHTQQQRVQQPQQQQPQQQQQHPTADADEAHRYLRRHGVPSKVENIISSVLSERPEDPLLYIVEHLRSNSKNNKNDKGDQNDKQLPKERQTDANTSSTVVRDRKENQRVAEHPATRGDAPRPPHRSTEEVNTKTEPRRRNSSKDSAAQVAKKGGGEKSGGGGGDAPPEDILRSELTPATMSETPVHGELSGWAFPTSVANVTPPPDSQLQAMHTSFSSTRTTNICAMRPSSALMGQWNSLRSSRNETPYGPTSLRFGAAMADGALGSVGAASLDRDDSTRSDLSAFSVASVDMQDFLQEFRSARADCVGVETKMVDIEALSEILQMVNIPLPDIPLIADLFEEVKEVGMMRYHRSGGSGALGEAKSCDNATAPAEGEPRDRVYFDAFLARMAFMIQGRYPAEVIRGTFYSILESTVKKKCSADGVAQQPQQQQQQQQQQPQQPKGTGEEMQHAGSNSGSATVRSGRTAVKGLCRTSSNTGNGNSSSLATADSASATLTHTYPSVTLPNTAHCAAPSENVSPSERSTLLHGVPLAVCVEEGLWRGLGIPVGRAEVLNALHMIGIPTEENYEFHVNDFVRLVTTLTGQNAMIPLGERGSPWVVSSLPRENSFLPFGGSCREENP
ncbi:hypothetical protein DQ04_06311010 [Trypanosoma grayi]|uniref:hypothetical protein n=1 Tax=Trypanosoma grayi TaxID=71804 RepID=UPI0004F4B8A2|nr:hypothetical protein DQ04_06311010 [Trypanosoma grayi]KEG08852.1 hypothetical protein DQ04_06311010 [Trypanosoma grayi]